MLVTAFALWVATRRSEELRWRDLILFALALGMLPWLHRKYAPYGLALVLVTGWAHRASLMEFSRQRLVILGGLYVMPQLLLLAWTWSVWGTFGGALMLERAPFSLAAFRSGIVGLLVDREHGLLIWAPVYAMVPTAWLLTRRDSWPLVLPTLILFVLSASHDQWWGGWCPAGRYLVPLAPIAAYVVARAGHYPSIRALALLLLPLQALITVVIWQRPRLLWPRGSGVNLLLDLLLDPLSRVQWLLPSLVPPPVSPTAEGHGWLIVAILLAVSIGLGHPRNIQQRGRVS